MKNNLTDCLINCDTIGIAGMCKNAGKTTVLNYLIDELREDYIIGITSIGYDGEKRDEITLLDKPRIAVYPGMLAATCESCLDNSTAKYKKVMDTGIRTAMGEITVVKIKGEGYMEIAGPSMVSQIEAITVLLKKSGCSKVFVDGAAGRTSFASRMEGTVLSVGAAMSRDMGNVVRAAQHQAELFSLELSEKSYAIKFANENPFAVLKDGLDAYFIFRGALVTDDLINIMKHYKEYKKTVVVNDASCVFVQQRIYKKFLRDGEIRVQNRTNLAAVTINPMSPYGKWFDKDKFMREMQEHLEFPVFNVMDEKEKEDGQQIKY